MNLLSFLLPRITKCPEKATPMNELRNAIRLCSAKETDLSLVTEKREAKIYHNYVRNCSTNLGFPNPPLNLLTSFTC